MDVKKLLVIVCSVFLVVNLAKAQDYQYIGATKCKMCHNRPDKGKQYDIWKSGPHAKAMDVLASEEAKKYSENPQKDKKCLKCHSTFHSADAKLMRGIKENEGVSCESCHGPGSKYKSMTIMKNRQKAIDNGMVVPNEVVCKKCHNDESPTFKGFDYAKAYAKIKHPNPKSK